MPGRGVHRLQEIEGKDCQTTHSSRRETLVRYDAEVPLLQSEGIGDTRDRWIAVGGKRGAFQLRQEFCVPRRRDRVCGGLRRQPMERVFDGYSLFHLPRCGSELLAMTSRDFFELVARMRRSQKEYFKNRSRLYLRESKELEGRVDAEIERVEKMMGR